MQNKKTGTCKDIEVYQRVVGFFRPVKLWNKGKVEEYKKRKTFKIGDNNVQDMQKRKERILCNL